MMRIHSIFGGRWHRRHCLLKSSRFTIYDDLHETSDSFDITKHDLGKPVLYVRVMTTVSAARTLWKCGNKWKWISLTGESRRGEVRYVLCFDGTETDKYDYWSNKLMVMNLEAQIRGGAVITHNGNAMVL